MRWLRVILFVLALGLALAMNPGVGAVHAQDAVPTVTITAKDYAFALPAQVEAGPTRFVLQNEGQEPHHAQLMRLNDGVTQDDVMAALQSGDVGQLLQLVAGEGGPATILPDGKASAVVDLEPGTYMVVCFVEDAEGVPHVARGMLAMFEVTSAEETATAPEADGTVTLRDFEFDLPETIQAGDQVWQVTNEGPQLHEMALLKLAPGSSMDDVTAFISGEAEGPPPFAPIGGVQGLSVGESNWAPLSLDAGEYLVICLIPDPETGKSHAELGMVASFSITGEQAAASAPPTMPETGGEQGGAWQPLVGWASLVLLAGLALWGWQRRRAARW